MGGETLLLSASWEPLKRISWQRAVALWLKDQVEIVEEYDDRELRSATFSMKMPSVIRHLFQKGVRRRRIKFSRENVYARDKGCCQYCGKNLKRNEFDYEHVIPKCRGGKTTWENIVVACVPCNQRKGNRTPEEAGMRLRSKPIRPKSLPDTHLKLTFSYDPTMPKSWASYLRDIVYWHGELENDNE